MPIWPATIAVSCCVRRKFLNHPEIIRRLGLIAICKVIEADILRQPQTRRMSWDPGERHRRLRDFARNDTCRSLWPRTAQQGTISTLCRWCRTSDTRNRMCSHFHRARTRRLRGLSPSPARATSSSRSLQPGLTSLSLDYLTGPERCLSAKHTPHLLTESLGWQQPLSANRKMRPQKRTERRELKIVGSALRHAWAIIGRTHGSHLWLEALVL